MTEREYNFRDAEVRSLPLRAANAGGRLLARGGIEVPSLDLESIVALAHKKAGTIATGGDSFREPLEIYLKAAREEADLNTFGRLAVRTMLVNALANRFRLAEWTAANSQAQEQTISAPWVIVGLPRTGTSLLSILLGLDPNVRALLHWEAAAPIPPPTLATAAEDPRIERNAKELAQLKKLNPAVGAMHPFGATIAQECVALFMFDVRTLGVETQAYVPSYGRWLQDCDMTPAYAQHKLALQALQAGQPTERWVLKTPNHLWCLDTMFESYPDARVIWTHRDPGKVVTSLASLVNALQGMFTDREDPVPTAEEWLGKAEHAMDSGMAFDDRSDRDWCQHVLFQELMADPIGTVKSLYGKFGESPSDLHVRRMQAWLAERGRDAEGRHVYDPADFGWSYDELAERFERYASRYGVTST